jgi:hypothetical protein
MGPGRLASILLLPGRIGDEPAGRVGRQCRWVKRWLRTRSGELLFCYLPRPPSLFPQVSPSEAQAVDNIWQPRMSLRALRDARTRQLVSYSTRRRWT